jgi:hypothetical protein
MADVEGEMELKGIEISGLEIRLDEGQRGHCTFNGNEGRQAELTKHRSIRRKGPLGASRVGNNKIRIAVL